MSNKYSDEELLNILTSLASDPTTTHAYRDIFKKVALYTQQLIKERDRESTKASDHLRKVTAVYDQYRVLETLYKEEHKKVLAQHDHQTLLEIQLAQAKKELEEALGQVTELNQTIEQLNESHKRATIRMGTGRRNIEEKLMDRDLELEELRRKYQELEALNSRNTVETERVKKENSQLRLLITYIQNPQQYQQQQPPPPPPP